MFKVLGERLQATFKKLRGKGKLTEQDVTETLREVRMALLEADVNLKVVRDFVAAVKERAVGQAVFESLTPGQHVIKIVHEELIKLLGGSTSRINLSPNPPSVLMLVGLQGSGKTTQAGKLARLLRKNGRHPLLVACDVYRPAAIDQLETLGRQLDIPVFSMRESKNPVEIARAAKESAMRQGRDLVIIDTAGRLHIDERLMQELQDICKAVHPHEILLVVDAMTGQDAVTVAEAFNKAISIDGIVMTKLDGDARGGAALSAKAVTGKPIKYIGMGEKLDALEVFHPDRMASRILGMGDVLSLIEKAEEALDVKRAAELEQKIRSQTFTLEDFLTQLQEMRNMGPLDQLLGMVPGFAQAKQLQNMQIDERELKRVEAVIFSMTIRERQRPEIIDGSRRKRIALGSGTSVQDVNRLLKQFEQSRKMMKNFADMGKRGGKKAKFPLV
ncbi:MAG: Signal recognition particle protein [Firmicutes bacterium]|nr:Signal recognition particle protein [candidate division NPL-UPA2 bacterium]MBT9155747.1 Signal recognition particle protein [candidate division NPL-UPA2 bacterium]